jgi:cleavage and polyadenylation specificity factor subunit 1
MELPLNEKQEVSKKIGARIEDICSDLVEIDNITHAF